MEPAESAAQVSWGSLPVPCVQELAKESSVTVPPRYVRPAQGQAIQWDPSHEVPVIDMQRLLSEESMDSELGRLHSASKEWGFFQLVNHGVSSSLVENIKTQILDFFNLPMEEKKNFWQKPGDLEGFGQAFVVSEEQKLDWGDMFYIKTLPISMRKPHLFPKFPLPFRDTVEHYSSEVNNLAMFILAQMAKALKMESEEMKELFEDGGQSMRMNYYPACPQPEQVNGISPHSDATGLTILLQLNEVEGLQIRKDGMWVPLKPVSGAFIVNIGDVLEENSRESKPTPVRILYITFSFELRSRRFKFLEKEERIIYNFYVLNFMRYELHKSQI
ncbi:protein SRG1-like isoform X3 [Malania oleifera]|uniref:protein SRG1-like isoform X3 n=1 Tax=Malania oleifera TaxID=397392 RepID=UPI0025AE1D56|nr:protein SRG1-like isoform X3 [Malania oleifera]